MSEEKICDGCNKSYRSLHPQQKYCSKQCHVISSANKNWLKSKKKRGKGSSVNLKSSFTKSNFTRW